MHASFVIYQITHSSCYDSEMLQKCTSNRFYDLRYMVLSREAYTYLKPRFGRKLPENKN